MTEFQPLLSSNAIGSYDVISALNHELGFGFEIYFPNGLRRTYFSRHSSFSVIKLYHYADLFDSIISVEDVLIELKIASWNLRGATTSEKQLLIDSHAHSHNLSVVLLQETHLYGQTILTPHYEWILGPQPNHRRASRGCGFMIPKDLSYTVNFHTHSANILELTISLPTTELRKESYLKS